MTPVLNDRDCSQDLALVQKLLIIVLIILQRFCVSAQHLVKALYSLDNES